MSDDRDEGVILGIDLGTTFSAMAIVDRYGKPAMLPNADGHSTTPSVVHFYDREACVVGEEAVKMVVVDPTNVVRFIKRAMGEPDFSLEFFGRSYTPQELSGIILKKMKDDAEEATGKPVRDAVITVPAYFNSAQRGATAEAGAIAGLNVLSIINEPTAAAIAYGIERLGGERTILVFDLGGGTFDVTLMQIKGVSFRTVASDGNAELGGKDWDDRLLNHVAEQFIQAFGADPRDDPQPYQELYERCLSAKISLSSKPRAVVPVNFRGHRMVVEVSREQFEQMTTDLVEQCAETCELVLGRAGMRWEQLDEVLLVGGSTRMPMIRAMLDRVAGRRVARGQVHPDECVALGAALAGVLRHRPDHPALLQHRAELARRARLNPEAPPPADEPIQGYLPPARINDVTSHPLGIIVLNRQMQEQVVNLIPAATPVPCEKSGRFAYAYDSMTAVRVEVTEGDGAARDEVKVIGQVVLEDLPPRPKGHPIEVVYRYGINQILEIDIIEIDSGKTRRARMDLRGGLGQAGVAEAQAKVAAFKVH